MKALAQPVCFATMFAQYISPRVKNQQLPSHYFPIFVDYKCFSLNLT